jgi:hypothetical protein
LTPKASASQKKKGHFLLVVETYSGWMGGNFTKVRRIGQAYSKHFVT